MLHTSWLQSLQSTNPQEGHLHGAYGTCHYLRWGSTHAPAIICLHGASANAYWFSVLGSTFEGQYQVISLSFPGHGLSHWQDTYSLPLLLRAVDDAIALVDGPAILIGHSFGGRVALEYLRRYANKICGVCVLDPPGMRLPRLARKKNGPLRSHTIRPSKQNMIERFRFIPNQPLPDPFLCRYIAEHSILPVTGGWRWQFDPNFFLKLDGADFLDPQQNSSFRPSVEHVLFYGEHTTVTTQFVRTSLRKVFPAMQEVLINNAWHAIMLDQPEQIHQKIHNLASQWLP
ncbi:MAG: alpha/beta hydrolase [Pseudomonadota bacterium]|nr:alpha/beta hydrolase [Pseudomonadota bacterium]